MTYSSENCLTNTRFNGGNFGRINADLGDFADQAPVWQIPQAWAKLLIQADDRSCRIRWERRADTRIFYEGWFRLDTGASSIPHLSKFSFYFFSLLSTRSRRKVDMESGNDVEVRYCHLKQSRFLAACCVLRHWTLKVARRYTCNIYSTEWRHLL